MTRPSALPPADSALPGTERLFDAGALARLLGVESVRLRYVEYDPGVRALVTVAAADRLAAVSIGCVAPVADGPQIAWYPDDPGLPGLRDGWAPLLDSFGIERGDEAPERLAWVPHRRLAVAIGGVVVKLHATGDETQHAVICARLAAAVTDVPEVVAVDVERAAHVQRRVAGDTIHRRDALATVHAAAGVVERLRHLDPAVLMPHTPNDVLVGCRATARLVRFVLPERADHLDAIVDRLAQACPQVAAPGGAHGDFNVGQLIAGDDGALVVVDTDTLCAAAPAYDPASYAANLVAGRAGDLDAARAVLTAFRQRLGIVDAAELDWYLAAMVARRLDRGLRRYKREWPERTNRLIDAADTLTARL
jgi:hypothetical protein